MNDESELLLFLLVPSVSAVADRLRKGLSVAVFGCTGRPLDFPSFDSAFAPDRSVVCLTATSASLRFASRSGSYTPPVAHNVSSKTASFRATATAARF